MANIMAPEHELAERALIETAAKLIRSLDADARAAFLDHLVDGYVDTLVRVRPDLTADELASRALGYREAVQQLVASGGDA